MQARENKSQVLAACAAGDIVSLKKIILQHNPKKEPHPLSVRDERGRGPKYYAIKHSKLEMLKYLRQVEDANPELPREQDLIRPAILANMPQIVRQLVTEFGLTVDANLIQTMLPTAESDKMIDTLLELKKSGHLKNVTGKDFVIGINNLIAKGHLSSVKKYFSRKPPKILDELLTVNHAATAAINNGNVAILKELGDLLHRHPQIPYPSTKKDPALRKAILEMSDNIELFKSVIFDLHLLLTADELGVNLFIHVCGVGKLELFNAIVTLSSRANVNYKCGCKHGEIVDKNIKDFNAYDEKNKNALLAAVKNKRQNIILSYLANNIPHTACDELGRNIFLIIIMEDDDDKLDEILEVLKSHAPDKLELMFEQDNLGNDIGYYLVHYKSMKCFESLFSGVRNLQHRIRERIDSYVINHYEIGNQVKHDELAEIYRVYPEDSQSNLKHVPLLLILVMIVPGFIENRNAQGLEVLIELLKDKRVYRQILEADNTSFDKLIEGLPKALRHTYKGLLDQIYEHQWDANDDAILIYRPPCMGTLKEVKEDKSWTIKYEEINGRRHINCEKNNDKKESATSAGTKKKRKKKNKKKPKITTPPIQTTGSVAIVDWNQIETVQKLINTKDVEGLRAYLTTQSSVNDIMLCRMTLVNGQMLKENVPLLEFAIFEGNAEIVKLLLDSFDPCKTHTTSKSNYLHLAVSKGDINIIEVLINASQKLLHMHDSLKRTPLHIAAMNSFHNNDVHGEIFKLLMLHGAAIHMKDKDNVTPFHLYINNMLSKKPSVINDLLEYPINNVISKKTLLHLACKKRDIGAINLLLKSGADPEVTDSDGKTPLELVKADDIEVQAIFAQHTPKHTYQEILDALHTPEDKQVDEDYWRDMCFRFDPELEGSQSPVYYRDLFRNSVQVLTKEGLIIVGAILTGNTGFLKDHLKNLNREDYDVIINICSSNYFIGEADESDEAINKKYHSNDDFIHANEADQKETPNTLAYILFKRNEIRSVIFNFLTDNDEIQKEIGYDTLIQCAIRWNQSLDVIKNLYQLASSDEHIVTEDHEANKRRWLFLACQINRADVVRFIREQNNWQRLIGVDIYRHCIIEAIQNNNIELIDALTESIQLSIDDFMIFDDKPMERTSYLDYAVSYGSVGACRLLLQKFPLLLNLKHSANQIIGMTDDEAIGYLNPVRNAIKAGNPEIIEVLLDADQSLTNEKSAMEILLEGVKLIYRARDKSNQEKLAKRIEVVQLLLKKIVAACGKNPKFDEHTVMSLLFTTTVELVRFAYELGITTVTVDFLRLVKLSPDAVAILDYLKTVLPNERFINLLNSVDSRGERLFNYLITEYNTLFRTPDELQRIGSLIDYLLNNGVDLNSTNQRGVSPLKSAIPHASADLIKKLIEKGAKVSLVDVEMVIRKGREDLFPLVKQKLSLSRAELTSLLFIAVESGQYKLVIQLIEAGADVFAVNKQKHSVVHLAALFQQENLLVYLLNYLKILNKPELAVSQDKDGRTPLHLATISCFTKGVKLLLDYQRDNQLNMIVSDNNGKMPIDYLSDKQFALVTMFAEHLVAKIADVEKNFLPSSNNLRTDPKVQNNNENTTQHDKTAKKDKRRRYPVRRLEEVTVGEKLSADEKRNQELDKKTPVEIPLRSQQNSWLEIAKTSAIVLNFNFDQLLNRKESALSYLKTSEKIFNTFQLDIGFDNKSRDLLPRKFRDHLGKITGNQNEVMTKWDDFVALHNQLRSTLTQFAADVRALNTISEETLESFNKRLNEVSSEIDALYQVFFDNFQQLESHQVLKTYQEFQTALDSVPRAKLTFTTIENEAKPHVFHSDSPDNDVRSTNDYYYDFARVAEAAPGFAPNFEMFLTIEESSYSESPEKRKKFQRKLPARVSELGILSASPPKEAESYYKADPVSENFILRAAKEFDDILHVNRDPAIKVYALLYVLNRLIVSLNEKEGKMTGNLNWTMNDFRNGLIHSADCVVANPDSLIEFCQNVVKDPLLFFRPTCIKDSRLFKELTKSKELPKSKLNLNEIKQALINNIQFVNQLQNRNKYLQYAKKLAFIKIGKCQKMLSAFIPSMLNNQKELDLLVEDKVFDREQISFLKYLFDVRGKIRNPSAHREMRGNEFYNPFLHELRQHDFIALCNQSEKYNADFISQTFDAIQQFNQKTNAASMSKVCR